MLDNDPSLNHFSFNEFKEYLENIDASIDVFQKENDFQIEIDKLEEDETK